MATRKRATIEVSTIKATINNSLAVSTCSPEERRAMASILENILHETGNYNGFNYLEWLNGGHTQWVADGSPQPIPNRYFGDMTRVRYY